MFTQRQIESGKYHSIEEVLVEGLRSLCEKEDFYQGRLEELRQEAQRGIESIARGELMDLDTAMDAIREKCNSLFDAWLSGFDGVI